MKYWIAGAMVLAGTAAVTAQTIDPAMKPQPGQYESRIKLLSIDIPGVPSNMMGMMRGAMERKTKICLTAEEVEEGYKQALKKSQDGDCRYNSFSATGGRIKAEMVCDTETGPMTIQMDGTGNRTSSDVTMNVSGNMGMGSGSMSMRVIQERIGDC